ncbi:MAG: ABC transporter ATP-binding protein [Veillonellaceae bacterium]|nr:ABC transporter ATP-binding protein [Veillonellaceae bacterium]
MNAIETRDLTCRFGDFTAVDRLNLCVREGEIYGLLGANGSGKSTTIRMLCGVLPPTAGTARILGHDLHTESQQIKAKLGYMSQKFSLYPDLTVGENLEFYASLYGLDEEAAAERIATSLAEVGATKYRQTRVRALAGGWRQRLALAAALLHRPRLLFLDEPTSGADPAARERFWQIIRELAAGGTTIVVTTHFMDEGEYCDRIGLMQAGCMIAEGSPAELVAGIPGTIWVWPGAAQPLPTHLPAGVYVYGADLRLQADAPPADWPETELVTVEPNLEDAFIYYLRREEA